MIIHKYQSSLDEKFTCDLRFNIKNAKVIVTIIDIKENKGPSLYTMYEALATEIYYQFLYETPIEDIIWIEHHYETQKEEIFYRVFMYWHDQCFTKARRRRLKEKEISKDKVEIEMDTVREAMACYGTNLWNRTYLVEALEMLLVLLRDKSKRENR